MPSKSADGELEGVNGFFRFAGCISEDVVVKSNFFLTAVGILHFGVNGSDIAELADLTLDGHSNFFVLFVFDVF